MTQAEVPVRNMRNREARHPLTVLVVGATGSIGRLVVQEALQRGHSVRALVRSSARANELPVAAVQVVGDLTRAETLGAAVDGVDAVIFTHGTTGARPAITEQVDYGAVRNVLEALQGRHARIALMTSIGVTCRDGEYNRGTEAHDWKRRGERLLRASGLPYTIVRPGWFDYHRANQLRLVMLQGDTRHAGGPGDGVVSRRQIAQVLVASLGSNAARGKTFELVAEDGPAQADLEPLFDATEADRPDDADGVLDMPNMPAENEPQRVKYDLERRRLRAGRGVNVPPDQQRGLPPAVPQC